MAFPLKKLISSFLPIFSPTTIVNLSEPPCVRYKSIISFGDSSADTGNFLSLSDDINHPPQAAFLPYGETFFHPPSGRYFDCRLIIDFIAEFLAVEDPGLNFIWVKPCKKKSKVSTVGFETGFKLLEVSQREFDQQSYWYFNVNPYKTYIYPNLTCVMCNPILSSGSATGSWDNLIYVPPYFGSKSVSFDQGVKFAVYGATALDRALLVEKGIKSDFTNRGVRRLADTHGRVGVNDYNYPFFEGESINEIKELVPLVIKAISSAIVELIDLGGKTFLVPGNFPLGCFPAYLTLFETSEKEHDPFTGCIPWLNDFGEYHNEQLKTELTQLQKLYPHVC